MAVYAGETVRLRVTATDYDDVAITGDAATPPTGTVDVYDSDGELVFNESLTWDSDKEYWYFDWDTTTADAGNYRIRARFVGVGGVYDTWEYGRISIKTNPVTIS